MESQEAMGFADRLVQRLVRPLETRFESQSHDTFEHNQKESVVSPSKRAAETRYQSIHTKMDNLSVSQAVRHPNRPIPTDRSMVLAALQPTTRAQDNCSQTSE